MRPGQASRTALGAAGHRAAHQVLEHGAIFSDPLALRILGAEAQAAIDEARREPVRRPLRMFIAARARFAEDALARALRGGARQLVVLGAGLDTTAYRASLPAGARAFEVDHPATQAWKRERLVEAGIAISPALTFAPIDFERGVARRWPRRGGFRSGRAELLHLAWRHALSYRACGFCDARLHRRAAGRRGGGVRLRQPPKLGRRSRAPRHARSAGGARRRGRRNLPKLL